MLMIVNQLVLTRVPCYITSGQAIEEKMLPMPLLLLRDHVFWAVAYHWPCVLALLFLVLHVMSQSFDVVNLSRQKMGLTI
jgi:hypothetical protein